MSATNGSPTSPLYAGEVFDTIAGFPTIYNYQRAENPDSQGANTPLIVCITGGLHLARVFYGGHDGSNPKNFLAHWLTRLGFGVLSLSYPLETTPVVMPLTAPAFRIQDWGRQAAMTTKKVIEEHNLTRSVVLISWSMAGRMVVRFNTSAKELGLDVQQYIAFAATPGLSSIRPLHPGLTCSAAGYFSIPPHTDAFYQQVEEMADLNGGLDPIIPRNIYEREYMGGSPINLVGLRLKYDGQGAFVPDEVPHEEDTAVLDVANSPLISGFYPTSILDASHALGDKAAWGFLLTYHLETVLQSQGLSKVRDPTKWKRILELVQSAPDRLIMPATGNHFFFIGERSSREVAEKVVQLIDTASELKKELYELLR